MDEMINNAEEFYQSLGVAYCIVNIVSGKRSCVREDMVYMHMCVDTCRLMIIIKHVQMLHFWGGVLPVFQWISML
jgi:hypothetical protein